MAQIKTYARLKPTKKAYKGYVISKNVLTMHIPDNKDFVILGPQNNYRSNFSYDILFTNIFGTEASQEEVFDGVAKDIIQNFLNGYNGTIFAYGQTGTGKTYTVEGNTNRYNARGLATRALSMIYQELEKRSDQHISVYLSYLEIYQEVAYDLLNPAARSSVPIAPFAKVTVVEGPRGSCILRGLSLHLAANEEIAQMLLLQGQANRRVAETPVNQRSSRSHAVFTVYLQVRKHDSDVLVNSKLHLVDLAGSERVSKTGVDGQQLTEAKSINLSLHHLETVIIALQLEKPTPATKVETPPQQSRSNTSLMSSGPSSDNGGSRQLRFVPYRNSLLTMVLKDSLGGNCLTAMIATISLEPENLGESISTCRFAQRVARIANNARRNEEIDDKALIKRLKNKVAYLENQVSILRSKGRSEPMTEEEILNVLTDEDQRICERVMEGFLQGVIDDPVEAGIADHCRFRACLHLLRQQFLSRGLPSSSGGAFKQHAILGSSASTSTLLAMRNGSPADHLIGGSRALLPGGGANNPKQDSGDYAARPGTKTNSQDTSRRENENKDSQAFKLVTNGLPNDTEDEITSDLKSLTAEAEGIESKRGGTGALTKAKVINKKGGASAGGSGANNFTGIEEVLQACNGGSGSADQRYKSPYERRREKEIRRLSRKLTEMEEDTADRENYLQQMKEQAIVEELLVAETGLRLKLQVAEEQVADQHAYLLQLKHLQADPDLIAKEQLVEKQLRKRQAKFHEKLTKVLASKEKLESDFSQQKSASGTPGLQQQQLPLSATDSREGSAALSVEDKYGQYKQGKGSLNTRQVFDMLKNQEKKQQKESTKLERETNMVKTKQLAIKEAATLEKLRELKQMLKLSLLKEEQQQQQPDITHPHTLAGETPTVLGAEKDFSASCSHWGQNIKEPGTRSLCEGIQTHKGHSEGESRARALRQQAWTMHDQNQSRHSSNSNIEVDGHYATDQSRNVQQFMSEMMNGNASHVAKPHDSVQSHFWSAQPDLIPSPPLAKQEAFNKHDISGSNNKSLPICQSSKLEIQPSTSKSFHEPHHSLKFCDATSGEKLSKESLLALSDKPERFLSSKGSSFYANNNTNNANHARDGELLLSDLEPIPLAQQKTKVDSTYDVTLTTPNSDNTQVSPSPVPNLLTLQQQIQQQQQQNHMPVVPPSEYINSMSRQDKFDARRMGLSSRTFESALTHMLDQRDETTNVPQLPYSKDPYQEFSRSQRQQSSPSKINNKINNESPYFARSYAQTSPKRKPGNSLKFVNSSSGETSTRTTSVEAASAWGPEAKNASVADRLSNLLGTPSSFSPTSTSFINESILTGSHHEKERSKRGDTFQTKLDEFKKQTNDNKGKNYSNNNHIYDSDDDVEDSKDYLPKCDEDEEDRSFLGVHPAQTKLTALKPEEGEKTFLSAVAAEKARVEKIRRARDAAEVIQRCWRNSRPRQ